jgi:hypothetical protein
MKRIRQLCAGTVLMLVFAVAAFAGDIDCPGITSQPTATGEIECGLSVVVVNLLETALLLF